MYRPRDWPELASQLASAVQGDAKGIYDMQMRPLTLNPSIPDETLDSAYAVMCLDSLEFSDVERGQVFEWMVEEVVNKGSKVYPHFVSVQGFPLCHHWRVHASERFTGPFNHTLNNEILIIGNTADVSVLNPLHILSLSFSFCGYYYAACHPAS